MITPNAPTFAALYAISSNDMTPRMVTTRAPRAAGSHGAEPFALLGSKNTGTVGQSIPWQTNLSDQSADTASMGCILSISMKSALPPSSGDSFHSFMNFGRALLLAGGDGPLPFGRRQMLPLSI